MISYIKRQVFPHAPSPTITSFLRISAMMSLVLLKDVSAWLMVEELLCSWVGFEDEAGLKDSRQLVS